MTPHDTPDDSPAQTWDVSVITDAMTEVMAPRRSTRVLVAIVHPDDKENAAAYFQAVADGHYVEAERTRVKIYNRARSRTGVKPMPRKEFTDWLIEQGHANARGETMYEGWHAHQWRAHGAAYLAWCEANGFEPENLDGV